MPTPEEVKALAGEPAQPSVVSVDEYRKVLQEKQQIENQVLELRKLENKRDNEIREARELKERLESKRDVSDNVLEDGSESIEDKIAKAIAATRDSLRADVEQEVKLNQRVTELQSEVKQTIEKYPYVKESELLDFMKRNPQFDNEKAVKALYPDEYYSKGGSVAETDKGGRTISVKAEQAPTDNGLPARRGFGILRRGETGKMADVISASIQRNLDNTRE